MKRYFVDFAMGFTRVDTDATLRMTTDAEGSGSYS